MVIFAVQLSVLNDCSNVRAAAVKKIQCEDRKMQESVTESRRRIAEIAMVRPCEPPPLTVFASADLPFPVCRDAVVTRFAFCNGFEI